MLCSKLVASSPNLAIISSWFTALIFSLVNLVQPFGFDAVTGIAERRLGAVMDANFLEILEEPFHRRVQRFLLTPTVFPRHGRANGRAVAVVIDLNDALRRVGRLPVL